MNGFERWCARRIALFGDRLLFGGAPLFQINMTTDLSPSIGLGRRLHEARDRRHLCPALRSEMHAPKRYAERWRRSLAGGATKDHPKGLSRCLPRSRRN